MVNVGSAMRAEQAQGSDIRGEARTPSQIAGRIVLASLVESRNVMLRDISCGGAKLTIGDWPDLPRNFYLMLRAADSEEPMRVECDRRWQVGPTIGVRFIVPLAEEFLERLFSSGGQLPA